MNTHTQAAELLARVRSGDREALGELYVRCRPVMEGYLTRRMPMCPGDVEDVLQDAFVRVMESPRLLDGPPSQVRRSLCGVAGYTLADHKRYLWRYRQGAASAGEARRRPATESVEERETRPLSARVVTALTRLAPAQRRDMQLRYLDGLSLRHAAQAAKVSTAAVDNNCVAARKQLRTALADLAPDSTAPLRDMNKSDAIRAAYEAVGELDAPAAAGWLRAQGIRTGTTLLYDVRRELAAGTSRDRHGRRGRPTRLKHADSDATAHRMPNQTEAA
jgi:RNA polymerase sigma-70 factor (ECF subfamily)